MGRELRRVTPGWPALHAGLILGLGVMVGCRAETAPTAAPTAALYWTPSASGTLSPEEFMAAELAAVGAEVERIQADLDALKGRGRPVEQAPLSLLIQRSMVTAQAVELMRADPKAPEVAQRLQPILRDISELAQDLPAPGRGMVLAELKSRIAALDDVLSPRPSGTEEP